MLARRLQRLGWYVVLWAVGTAPALRADATIRYQADIKWAEWIPPQLMETVKVSNYMPGTVVRMKGGKGLSSFGELTFVVDIEKQEVTVIDAAHRSYCTLPFSEYSQLLGSELRSMPGAGTVLSTMHPKAESRLTGQTAVIQGVQAEERVIIFSMQLPESPGIPENARTMRWVLRIWSATPAETERVRVIGEYMKLSAGQRDVMSALGMSFSTLPGMDPKLVEGIADAFKQPYFPLRTHVEVYMPLLGLIVQKMAEQAGRSAPVIDTETPMVVMDRVVTELSDDAVDGSLFEVPPEYTKSSSSMVRDAFRGMAGQTATSAAVTGVPGNAGVIGGIIGSVPMGAPPPGPSAPPPGVQRIRVGGNVAAAKLIRQPKPVYPPLAKQARISGIVRLNVILNKDGTVQNLSLVSGHPLLVPAAMEAVKQWVYAPTLLNGQPVEVVTQIEVNFALSKADEGGEPAAPAEPPQ